MIKTKSQANLHHMAAAKANAAAADVEKGIAVDNDDNKKEHGNRSHWQYIRSFAWLRSVVTLAVLYCSALSIIALLFKQLPPLDSLPVSAGDARILQLEVPHSFEDLRLVRHTLELYRMAYGGKVIVLLTASYLFLQTFMMPGSLGINILLGSLYPTSVALTYVIVVSTIGASCNFLLTRWLLKDIIMGLFPGRILGFQQELKRHHAHLLNYMLFIRVTPILPAWFVNLASPVVGVPFATFVIATCVGHLPVNIITVQAGATLQTIQHMHDLYSPRNVFFMMCVGSLALVPVVWKRRRARTAAEIAHRQQRTVGKSIPIIERPLGSVV